MPAVTRQNAIKQAAEFGIVKGGQKPRRPAGVPVRYSRARAADGSGPDRDQHLLLGYQRPDARLGEALRGTQRWKIPDDGAGRRLLGGDCITSRRSKR